MTLNVEDMLAYMEVVTGEESAVIAKYANLDDSKSALKLESVELLRLHVHHLVGAMEVDDVAKMAFHCSKLTDLVAASGVFADMVSIMCVEQNIDPIEMVRFAMAVTSDG